MVYLNPVISIITLNVNLKNISQTLSGWIKKNAAYRKSVKGTHRLKVK